jgi:hypothetical protein
MNLGKPFNVLRALLSVSGFNFHQLEMCETFRSAAGTPRNLPATNQFWAFTNHLLSLMMHRFGIPRKHHILPFSGAIAYIIQNLHPCPEKLTLPVNQLTN